MPESTPAPSDEDALFLVIFRGGHDHCISPGACAQDLGWNIERVTAAAQVLLEHDRIACEQPAWAFGLAFYSLPKKFL